VPVAARVINGRLGVAGGATLEVAAHRGRAAGGQGREDFALLHAQVGSLGGEELGSVAAEDFADFERRLGFRATGGGSQT